jgi:hypothetical protein
MQYFKYRTKSLDDYYPCNSDKHNCDLQHVYNWIKLFDYLIQKLRNTILFKIGDEIVLLTEPSH